MALGPIPREDYLDFIEGWFNKGGFKFSREDLVAVFYLAGDVPYDVQRICHNLWEMAQGREMQVTRKLIEEVPRLLASQNSPTMSFFGAP